jgi:hypothetical protein
MLLGGHMKLVDLVQHLKEELKEARPKAGDELFALEACEIEVDVAISEQDGAKVSISVLGVGGEVGGQSESTKAHRMRLKFRPLTEERAMQEQIEALGKVVGQLKERNIPVEFSLPLMGGLGPKYFR